MSQSQIRRITDRQEILSILQKIPNVTESEECILIGSRAALKFLPHIRDTEKSSSLDHDWICSSIVLLEILRDTDSSDDINTIEMIIPMGNEESSDLYVNYTRQSGEKYDLVIPQSTTSYAAYLLNHIDTWTYSETPWDHVRKYTLRYASKKLLLILKKYMLYYPNQWQKTANDYQQLLFSIGCNNNSIADDEKEFCDLFIQYNEKLHGPRASNTDSYFLIKYARNEFLQLKYDEQVACIYQSAKALSFGEDILLGLEDICTKSPPWLADFVIEHWMDIHNEKFKNNIHRQPTAIIQCELNNHRLIEQLPELAMQKILYYITNPVDFESMKLVCKRWYVILHQSLFWHDLYTSRFGCLTENTIDWKLLYMTKVICPKTKDKTSVNRLIDANVALRKTTANDVVRLWEELTHRSQSVPADQLADIDYILSHSWYYDLNQTSDEYSAKLILVGFDRSRPQMNISIDLRVGEFGSSRFTDHMEQLTVNFPRNQRSLSFMGPALFGFSLGEWSYSAAHETLLKQTNSEICPRFFEGLVNCLFILMVHPIRRTRFISYLKSREAHCMANQCQWD